MAEETQDYKHARANLLDADADAGVGGEESIVFRAQGRAAQSGAETIGVFLEIGTFIIIFSFSFLWAAHTRRATKKNLPRCAIDSSAAKKQIQGRQLGLQHRLVASHGTTRGTRG